MCKIQGHPCREWLLLTFLAGCAGYAYHGRLPGKQSTSGMPFSLIVPLSAPGALEVDPCNQQVRCCRPFEVFAAVAHTPTYCASTWRLYGDPYGLINIFYSDEDDGIASSSSSRRAVAEGRGSVRVKEDGYSREQAPPCLW